MLQPFQVIFPCANKRIEIVLAITLGGDRLYSLPGLVCALLRASPQRQENDGRITRDISEPI
jgi:hypothetical protein